MFLLLLLLAAVTGSPYLVSIAVATNKVQEMMTEIMIRIMITLKQMKTLKNIILSKYVVHGATVW
jgi:hypothetical protein